MSWTDWNKILDCKNKRPRVLILIMLLDSLNEFSNDLSGKKNDPGFTGGYKELEREVGKTRNCKLQVGKLELKLEWMKLETLYCIGNFPTSICTFQLIWKLFNFKLTNLKVSNSFFSNCPFQLHISPGLGLGNKCSLKKKLEKMRSWKALSWEFWCYKVSI